MSYAWTAIVCLMAGMVWGRWTMTKSLTIAPEADGVTGAHKIGDGFYYLVPERLWVRLLVARRTLDDD